MALEKLNYKIDVFEGPLDLMLSLISKHKLDIYDIPISSLLEQYMQQIDRMQREDMEIASEFLEMAAKLVHIKSVSLLPRQEEAEELKLELTGQLIEYKLCKEAAVLFSEQISFDRFVREAQEIEPDLSYKNEIGAQELLSALLIAAGRHKSHLPPKPESFSEIVSKRIVSVTSQVVSILRSLWKTKRLRYLEVFAGKQDKSERVAAFLAVLELVKGQRVRIEGNGENSFILLMDGSENG